ncbi:MAG TPA: FAD-binding oxidoreductase [Planctomycetota bacterium]
MSARVVELLGGILPAERIGAFAGPHGHAPAPEARPASPEEALEVLRLARGERWRVLPLGQGTRLAAIRPRERVDLVLSSRNLRGITSYEPADGTLTALAGTPWGELVAATEGRHHLSPELARTDGTLGGAIAAGHSGLDRLRHGPLRHQILGLAALHADGSRVKSGGRVVKNVTGYDLHRLWCGSEGTLCFLLEGTLRLYPAPAETVVLRLAAASPAEAVARAHALWRAGLQPLAAVVRAATFAGAAELALVLAGRAEAVAHEVALVRAQAGGVEELRAEAARAARAELCAAGTEAALLLATRPSRLPAALAALGTAADGLGLPLRLTLHPLLATAAVELPGVAARDERLAELGEELARTDTHLRWHGLGARAPRPRLDPAASELMQRLKRSLDPEGLFAGGPP